VQTTQSVLPAISSAISAISNAQQLSQFGSSLFIMLNAQQFIKAMVLVGDIGNKYVVTFLQAGVNLDLDPVPYEYLPEVKVGKQVIESK